MAGESRRQGRIYVASTWKVSPCQPPAWPVNLLEEKKARKGWAQYRHSHHRHATWHIQCLTQQRPSTRLRMIGSKCMIGWPQQLSGRRLGQQAEFRQTLLLIGHSLRTLCGLHTCGKIPILSLEGEQRRGSVVRVAQHEVTEVE